MKAVLALAALLAVGLTGCGASVSLVRPGQLKTAAASAAGELAALTPISTPTSGTHMLKYSRLSPAAADGPGWLHACAALADLWKDLSDPTDETRRESTPLPTEVVSCH